MNSALQHLTAADGLARSAAQRASAKLLIGQIQERYLANRPAALAAYQGAVQLEPNSQKAKESVARLRKTEEILQAKRIGGGR